MKCGGLHCDGCGSGGGAGGLAGAALLVIIVAAAVRAHGHQIARGIEITGYVLIGITAAAVVAAVSYGVLRARRRVLEGGTRRISPRVRAVITDARAGRPARAEITASRRALSQARPVLWLEEERPWTGTDGQLPPEVRAEIERIVRMGRKGRDR